MKTKVMALVLLAVCVLSMTSCGDASPYTDKTIFGMDSYVTLRLADDGVSSDELDGAAEKCAGIIARHEKLMSCHDENAHVYALNNSVDMILDPATELKEVISSALNIARITDGAFSPALGALTELWNVTDGGPVPSEEEIESALEHSGYGSVSLEDGKLTRDAGVKLDLGGIAKGYTVQKLLEYLSRTDIPYGVVSMGGNIGVFGEKDGGSPFKVGLCDPDDTASVVGYLHINDGFVAVSGDYERFFEENGEKYHHIIDPKTGYPAKSGLRSVAVLSNNGAAADALSTALFVMGEERAFELYRSGKVDFEAVFITDKGEIVLTDGIASERFELSEDRYSVRAAEGVEVTLISEDN